MVAHGRVRLWNLLESESYYHTKPKEMSDCRGLAGAEGDERVRQCDGVLDKRLVNNCLKMQNELF